MAQVLILIIPRYFEPSDDQEIRCDRMERELIALIGVMMASKVHQNLRESYNPASKLKIGPVQYSEVHVECMILVSRVVW